MKHKFLVHYIFIEELNEIIKKNILILKNKKYRLNIITSDKNVHQISQFAKISRIPFYVIDNIKSAIKNYASGVFLSASRITPKPEKASGSTLDKASLMF